MANPSGYPYNAPPSKENLGNPGYQNPGYYNGPPPKEGISPGGYPSAPPVNDNLAHPGYRYSGQYNAPSPKGSMVNPAGYQNDAPPPAYGSYNQQEVPQQRLPSLPYSSYEPEVVLHPVGPQVVPVMPPVISQPMAYRNENICSNGIFWLAIFATIAFPPIGLIALIMVLCAYQNPYGQPEPTSMQCSAVCSGIACCIGLFMMWPAVVIVILIRTDVIESEA